MGGKSPEVGEDMYLCCGKAEDESGYLGPKLERPEGFAYERGKRAIRWSGTLL